MKNRRQFTRVLFAINATFEIEQKNYPVTIRDISLNGALATMPNANISLKGKLGLLHFDLANGESIVEMHVAVVHEVNDEVGLQCKAIDIDSVTHLRRLVELNLGDESQLHKEISQISR
jgi:hypothetical protein